jgi:hypothetical protein
VGGVTAAVRRDDRTRELTGRALIDAMSESEPSRPPEVTQQLGEHQLVLVHFEGNRYKARLDADPRTIRMQTRNGQCTEGASPDMYEPKREEGEAVCIDPLLRCLELGPVQRQLPRGVELSATDNWGHYRQNTYTIVTVTIGDDGAIEIDARILEQNDSFY